MDRDVSQSIAMIPGLWDEMQLRGTNGGAGGTRMKSDEFSLAFWRRRVMEGGFWILAIVVLWGLDTLTKMQVRDRTGIGKDNLGLITEQATSAAGVLIMLLFVAWWLGHYPLRRARLGTTVLAHFFGSIAFSLGHYTLLIWFRKSVYVLVDIQYYPPASLLSNLLFEYQKDIKIYLGIIIVITIYRNFLGGENRMQLRPAAAQRILVQTGSGESILTYEQIDYLESARNYIVVHSGEREFLIRETMSELLGKLAAGRFARSHRSYAVNLDKISEIVTNDSGHSVRLLDGVEVPLSRKYRDGFKSLLLQ